LPRNKGNPHCPACGSSATLPFEHEENARNGQSFSEIILIIFLSFLFLFSVFLLLVLSHAGLPRRQRENRRARLRPHPFVCLDCSHNFKA
jgi:hypothetical protein